MKEKFTVLLIILGGVLAVFTGGKINLLIFPIIIIGGACFGMSFLLYSCVYGGKIWGIKINASNKGKIVSILSVVGLIIGGYGAITTVLAIISSIASFKLLNIIIYLVAFIVPLVVGLFIANKITENLIVAKSDNALVLNSLEIFKDVESQIDQATNFVVGFEGVALFSNTNYCYAIYRYEDYQLGELTTPQEVALVGTYFVQKYHNKFTYKVDAEVIPGEPGKTVVAVGTGGIAVGRTSGTPDQRIFRSYIFTRK